MGRSIFGWDLPPGCSINDIPGNRPEDLKREAIYDNFWDKERLTKTHIGIRITEEEYERMDELYKQETPNISDIIDDYISAAIEYGMEIGRQEEKEAVEENKYYEQMAKEHEEEKLRREKDERKI